MLGSFPIGAKPFATDGVLNLRSLRVSQAKVFAATEGGDVNVTQAGVFGVINFPTEEMRATQVGAMTTVAYGPTIRTSQAKVLSLVKGVVDNPKLRAWYYTLDGHDFYILKLGTNKKTLVFDVSTGQWSWWSSGSNNHWRASIGMNWYSAGSIALDFGSNVIVGDDSSGILWVLDPEKGLDDALTTYDEVTFPRVATGQATAKSRQFIPVYNITLEASRGAPALTVNTVTLSYSDDQGNTFVTADEPQVVVSGNYAQEFRWLSLGQMRAPGRLVRIEDDGAFARIDALDVNE